MVERGGFMVVMVTQINEWNEEKSNVEIPQTTVIATVRVLGL